MHVDAVGKHGKGFSFEFQFNLSFLSRARPEECALFQSLAHQPDPCAIPVKDFEQTAPFVTEHEERSAARVFPELVHDQRMQRVSPSAHVARIQGDEDLKSSAKGQHDA